MRRWHQDVRVTRREWKKHRDQHVESNRDRSGRDRVGMDPDVVDCVCDDQVGRFRKTKGSGCGNGRCSVCHPGRCHKRQLTRTEKESSRLFQEQLREVADSSCGESAEPICLGAMPADSVKHA